MAKPTTQPGSGDDPLVVVENRRARYDFEVLDRVEAGLSLVGTEVKSLRAGGGDLRDAWVDVRSGTAVLKNMHIAHYAQGNVHNHEPTRDRPLLLHKGEIEDLGAQIDRKGNTVVPLRVHFVRGRAKVLLAVARGKNTVDKRRTIAERDTNRQLQQQLKERSFD